MITKSKSEDGAKTIEIIFGKGSIAPGAKLEVGPKGAEGILTFGEFTPPQEIGETIDTSLEDFEWIKGISFGVDIAKVIHIAKKLSEVTSETENKKIVLNVPDGIVVLNFEDYNETSKDIVKRVLKNLYIALVPFESDLTNVFLESTPYKDLLK